MGTARTASVLNLQHWTATLVLFIIRWQSGASPLKFQKYILGWQLLCSPEVEMVVPCMLHCCFCRDNVMRNLASTVLYTMQRANDLLPCGCSHGCCKKRAFAPAMGSVQVSGSFLPTLYTWRCTQRLWIISSCIHSCRSVAEFVISKPKNGGFFLSGLATTCNFFCSVFCKRTVGANLLEFWKHQKVPQSLGRSALQKMFARTEMAVLQGKSQLAVSYVVVPVKAKML